MTNDEPKYKNHKKIKLENSFVSFSTLDGRKVPNMPSFGENITFCGKDIGKFEKLNLGVFKPVKPEGKKILSLLERYCSEGGYLHGVLDKPIFFKSFDPMIVVDAWYEKVNGRQILKSSSTDDGSLFSINFVVDLTDEEVKK